MLYGLVAGWARTEFVYLQGTIGERAVNDSFLPLALFTNRSFAAAISVTGFWLLLINVRRVKAGSAPRVLGYIGAVAGALAVTGFLIPGGGAGTFGLLIAAIWGVGIGIYHLREASDQVSR